MCDKVLNTLWYMCSICKSWNCRSSLREVLCKKGVPKKIEKLIGKSTYAVVCNIFTIAPFGYSWRQLVSNFIRKRLRCKCFPVNLAKLSKTSFLENTSRQTLLVNWVSCKHRFSYVSGQKIDARNYCHFSDLST